jgi:hypothetical protein
LRRFIGLVTNNPHISMTHYQVAPSRGGFRSTGPGGFDPNAPFANRFCVLNHTPYPGYATRSKTSAAPPPPPPSPTTATPSATKTKPQESHPPKRGRRRKGAGTKTRPVVVDDTDDDGSVGSLADFIVGDKSDDGKDWTPDGADVPETNATKKRKPAKKTESQTKPNVFVNVDEFVELLRKCGQEFRPGQTRINPPRQSRPPAPVIPTHPVFNGQPCDCTPKADRRSTFTMCKFCRKFVFDMLSCPCDAGRDAVRVELKRLRLSCHPDKLAPGECPRYTMVQVNAASELLMAEGRL